MDKAPTPIVSVIIPTYQAERTLSACLKSIQEQTCPPDEVIVVDAGSADNTAAIARSFGVTFLSTTPNRSAQRNLGAQASGGDYLLFIDADMILSPVVIEECVGYSLRHPDTAGLVIPEQSFGETFWAHVKAFERSFYQGVDYMEAARWMPKSIFMKVGGYDPVLLGGEDWDLDERLRQQGPIGRVAAVIRHDEGALTLHRLQYKKHHYADTLPTYAARYPKRAAKQLSLRKRTKLFAAKPCRLLRHPGLSLGLAIMAAAELTAIWKEPNGADNPLIVEQVHHE
ncbi:MAG: glycosyltransferase [Firmicutes bacterium]|nr:glycosyltransferase [Bacillota bacterium]